MKKLFFILVFSILITSIILSGCVDNSTLEEDQLKTGDTQIISEELIEGSYNPKIEHGKIYLVDTWHDYSLLIYEKDDKTYKTAYVDYIINSFDWIKNFTTVYSTILCWWDYGGMIEGYCEREAIAIYPSIPLLDTIGTYGYYDEEGKQKYIEEHDFSDNDTIQEIAYLLTTENFSSIEIQDKIKEYNISYIFTRSYDKKLAGIFLYAAGKDLDMYFTDCDEKDKYCFGGMPTSKINDTLIYKMWEDEPDIKGLQLVYHNTNLGSNDPDENNGIVRIFLVTST